MRRCGSLRYYPKFDSAGSRFDGPWIRFWRFDLILHKNGKTDKVYGAYLRGGRYDR